MVSIGLRSYVIERFIPSKIKKYLPNISMILRFLLKPRCHKEQSPVHYQHNFKQNWILDWVLFPFLFPLWSVLCEDKVPNMERMLLLIFEFRLLSHSGSFGNKCIMFQAKLLFYIILSIESLEIVWIIIEIIKCEMCLFYPNTIYNLFIFPSKFRLNLYAFPKMRVFLFFFLV